MSGTRDIYEVLFPRSRRGPPLKQPQYLTRLASLDPAHESDYLREVRKLAPAGSSNVEPIELGRDTNVVYFLHATTMMPNVYENGRPDIPVEELDSYNLKFEADEDDDEILRFGLVLGVLMLGNPQKDWVEGADPELQLGETDFYVVMDILDKSLWLVLDYYAEDWMGEPIYTDLEDDEWPALLPGLPNEKIHAIKIVNGDWKNRPLEPLRFSLDQNFHHQLTISLARKDEVKKTLASLSDDHPVPPPGSGNTPEKPGSVSTEFLVTPPKVKQTRPLSTGPENGIKRRYGSMSEADVASSERSSSGETNATSVSPESKKTPSKTSPLSPKSNSK